MRGLGQRDSLGLFTLASLVRWGQNGAEQGSADRTLHEKIQQDGVEMARQESDREDLIREATALVERIELLLDGQAEPVVVGFRRDDSCSIFWGADPVYQFTSAYALRRLYRQGFLIKAEQGKLVSLERRRLTGEVALVRHELGDEEAASVIEEMQQKLHQLKTQIADRAFTVSGQAPEGADVVSRVYAWLETCPTRIEVAQRPNVG